MKVFIKILQTIWELPQNTAGLIAKKIFKATPYTTYKDAVVYSWSRGDGLSLGKYIFVPFKNADPTTYLVQQFIKHEYGHTVQSKYLGWLYLIIIGAPSLAWNKFGEKYRQKTNRSYYWFYTENWADKLGNVDDRAE